MFVTVGKNWLSHDLVVWVSCVHRSPIPSCCLSFCCWRKEPVDMNTCRTTLPRFYPSSHFPNEHWQSLTAGFHQTGTHSVPHEERVKSPHHQPKRDLVGLSTLLCLCAFPFFVLRLFICWCLLLFVELLLFDDRHEEREQPYDPARRESCLVHLPCTLDSSYWEDELWRDFLRRVCCGCAHFWYTKEWEDTVGVVDGLCREVYTSFIEHSLINK